MNFVILGFVGLLEIMFICSDVSYVVVYATFNFVNLLEYDDLNMMLMFKLY